MTAPLPLSQRLRPLLVFALAAGLVVAVEHRVVQLPAFGQRPGLLSWAVLLDVLAGLPLLCYLLVLRPYRLSPLVLGGVLSACLALVGWLLPAPPAAPQQLLRLLPAALEALTLGALLARAGALRRAWQAAAPRETHWLPRLRLAIGQGLGWPGTLLLAELDMLGYALLSWRTPVPPPPPGAASFGNSRESGFGALLVVACLGLLMESAALHLLVRLWSPPAAAWLLLADAYGLVLLVAHGRAVRLLPTVLTADELLLRVGFVWQVAVPRAAWPTATRLRGDFAPGPETLNAARPLLVAPNIMLTFAAPVVVTGLYGLRRPVRRLALYVDQPAAFVAALAAPDFSTR